MIYKYVLLFSTLISFSITSLEAMNDGGEQDDSHTSFPTKKNDVKELDYSKFNYFKLPSCIAVLEDSALTGKERMEMNPYFEADLLESALLRATGSPRIILQAPDKYVQQLVLRLNGVNQGRFFKGLTLLYLLRK